MAARNSVKPTAMRCFKTSVLFFFLFTGTFAADASASAGSSDPPAASPGAPPPAPEHVLQPTRESIYRHLAAELQHALGAEQHIKGVFQGMAAGIEDSVNAAVIPSLQVLVDSVVERAEDAWIAADDAGRTVEVKDCVDGAEFDAQQVAKRALGKMRGCMESLQQEGERRSREAARLLADIEGVSKRFVSALESCVRDEETKATAPPASVAEPAAPDPAAAGNAPVANDVAPVETAVEDINTSACTKDSAEGSPGATPCGCPKCKKAKAKAASSKEPVPTSDEEITQEEETVPKLKCKGGEKCQRLKESKEFKKGEKIPEGKLKEKKSGYQKHKKESEVIQDETVEVEVEEEADGTQEEQVANERSVKQGKDGKKMKYDGKGQKTKDKSKKDIKDEESNVEETVIDKGSKRDKTLQKEKYKKNSKKSEEISQEAEVNESTGEQTLDSTENEQKSTEGKNKKDKKYGKKDAGKGKGKKEKNQEVPSEGKGRRKRDLLAIQETPDETLDSVETVKSGSSTDQLEGESLNKEAEPALKWPTEGSTPEEKYVIACLQSPLLKPLIDEKTRVYQKLQGMLRRVQAKQEEAPVMCVTDHVRKAEMKISAIKARMASCADRKMREEL